MGDGMMGGGMMGQPRNSNDVQTLQESQPEEIRLFGQYCGQCHAPPAPSAHNPREWSEVVGRMKQHMVTQGKALPDNEELVKIVGYLQRYAK